MPAARSRSRSRSQTRTADPVRRGVRSRGAAGGPARSGARARAGSGRPMTVKDLWALPRVGDPVPSPDGSMILVPVTRISLEANKSDTRLWLVPGDAVRAGRGGVDDVARALTAEGAGAGSPCWSPDGARFAFVRRPGGEKGEGDGSATHPGPRFPDQGQLYVQSLQGGEAERVTDLPYGVIAPRWFADGRRLAFFSAVYETAPTLAGTVAAKKAQADTKVTARTTERRFFRYWDTWLTDERTLHLFVLDLTTGELADLTPRFHQIPEVSEFTEFDIAPGGEEIAFTALREPIDELVGGIYLVRVPARLGDLAAAQGTAAFARPVGGVRAPAAEGRSRAPKRARGRRVRLSDPVDVAPDFAASASTPAYSPDGRWLVYGIQKERDFYADKVRLVARDRESGRQTVLTEEWDHSATGCVFGSDSRTLYLNAEIQARSAIWALDVVKAARSPRGNPPVELARGGTFGAPRLGGDRIFTSVSSLSRPPEVVSLDLEGGDLVRTTAFTEPGLAGIATCDHEEVYFVGAEGRRVHMAIVYPPGVKKPPRGGRLRRRLPLVHMIHGGPHGVFGDQWHWRWCAPVFAAPGYVCALVNFHGSTSWGQEFAASILGRWGDQPYIDVMNATDYLIERGIADPQRMAVTGGSYGGYLVSWITSQTKRFRCAINHAGVADLQTQYASDVTHGRRRAIGGEAWADLEGLDRYNPMRHAKGFKTPMLIIHGEKDYRVPYAHAIETYNVYKAMGNKARLVVFPDENHWILKPQNSEHWYGEVLGWLGRHFGSARRR